MSNLKNTETATNAAPGETDLDNIKPTSFKDLLPPNFSFGFKATECYGNKDRRVLGSDTLISGTTDGIPAKAWAFGDVHIANGRMTIMEAVARYHQHFNGTPYEVFYFDSEASASPERIEAMMEIVRGGWVGGCSGWNAGEGGDTWTEVPMEECADNSPVPAGVENPWEGRTTATAFGMEYFDTNQKHSGYSLDTIKDADVSENGIHPSTQEDTTTRAVALLGGGFTRGEYTSGSGEMFIRYARSPQPRRSARLPMFGDWCGDTMIYPTQKKRAFDPRKIKESAWDKNPLSSKKPFGRKFK